jgi:hypothetical protein
MCDFPIPPEVGKAFGAGVDAFGNMVYTKGKNWAYNYVGGKIDQGLQAIGNRADTIIEGMSRPTFDATGYSPAPEFKQWQQNTNSTQAIKKAKAVNGQATSYSLSDGVACPAMFNPGRGAELGLVNKLIDQPLSFKTGEPAGPSRPQDAFSSQMQLYKGVRLAQAFAWKGIVPVNAPTTGLLTNRGYVHNVFRHYNYCAFGTGGGDYQFYGFDSGQWNNTLGPDATLVRTFPRVSAAQATALTTAGLNATLASPYRTPAVGAVMYSRLTQQFLENVGWACHPFKYVQSEMNSGSTLDVTQPIVYKNCGTDHWRYPKSMPAQQPAYPGTNISGKIHGSPYYYKSQFGKGKVAYDFSNDGTCPIVVDVVINKIKQGQTWNSQPLNTLEGNIGLLDSVYKNGYYRMATSNRNFTDTSGLSGQPVLDSDCLTNARCEFMPKGALKYSSNLSTSTPGNAPYEQPFKQVARDQFIISAGATRAWRFELPALDYDPRRYGNRSTATDGSLTDIVLEDICCDFTYVVSIAYSSVSTPLFEIPTGVSAKSAIIDRRPGDCNLSVTGSYEEYAYPVYLSKETLTNSYINSALDVPAYATAPPAGTITNNEIANLNQVTRGSTPGSALISVGAINTLPGA